MIGPIVQGSIRPIWSFTVVQDDNTPFNLTGATFTGVLYARPAAVARSLSGGTFAIASAALGTFTYSPVAADVDEAGEFELEMCIIISAAPIYVRDHVTILERYAA